MAWALPSHADLGGHGGELKELAWATIVGKKKVEDNESNNSDCDEANVETIVEGHETGEEETRETGTGSNEASGVSNRVDKISSRGKQVMSKYRWMAGKVYIPEKCGELFGYAVTSCGDFELLNEVIAVYLETLLFGLRSAKLLLQAIRANTKIMPLPSSGRKVMFGKVELPVKLKAKTKVGKRLPYEPDDHGYWKLSQGEIFTGTINFSSLKEKLLEEAPEVPVNEEFAQYYRKRAVKKVQLRDFVLFKDDSVAVDVVVKVSSTSVHGYLNHPIQAWLALQRIEFAYFESVHENQEDDETKSSGFEPSKKRDLFNVLYAAEPLPNALITIMADLSKDYTMLTPQKDKINFSGLWSAFDDLVRRVLLPLANIGCPPRPSTWMERHV